MHEDRTLIRDRRVKIGLILVGLATLALLVISALRENILAEWRDYRERYAEILQEKATDERGRVLADQFEVRIVQNVVPELGVIDRCVTCHPGVDDPRMAGLDQPLTAHPGKHLQIHPPETFGCTVCHQGQGRATETLDAHGRAPFWDYPLLDKKYMRAPCAKCHPETDLYGEENLLALASGAEGTVSGLLLQGKRLLDEKGCLGCHVLEGRGGTLGPDITLVGEKTRHEFDFSHFERDEPREVGYWLKKHFLEPAQITPDTVMPDMGLDEKQAEALTAYMLSLRLKDAPPAYIQAALFPEPPAPDGRQLYGKFCSACHGPDGEESDVPGIRTPSLHNADSLAVASDDYYRFIIYHGRGGSSMPAWKPKSGNLTRGEIDLVVTFIRHWEADGALVPYVHARAGDARMGKAYYRGLCTNCHGRVGQGSIGNTLNSATFLSVATDEFLGETIVNGRPGTAMPTWKRLSSRAVSDLLAHLRSWQETLPTLAETRKSLAEFDPAKNKSVGRGLYQGHCVSCHGDQGEGGIGLRLNSTDVLRAVDDAFLFATITQGRPSTAMPAWPQLPADRIGALLEYIRAWDGGAPLDLKPPPRPGDYAVGEIHYEVSCLRCHGPEAEGGVGPQLANPVLLRTVSNATLLHWIGRGRVGTAMKGFLSEEQGLTNLTPEKIADVIAYLRHAGSREHPAVLRTGIGDAAVGEFLFKGNCSSCHGVEGVGSSGPQLNNPHFLKAASDGFLAATMVLGRTETPMRSMVHGQEGLGQIGLHQVQDVIAYMRLWDYRQSWRKPRAVAEMSRRAIESGRERFRGLCQGCHGPDGQGLKDGAEYFAPGLNNQEFLEAASDGFLLATIARGRARTPMRPFGQDAGGIASLPASDINDVVSFIRTWHEEDIKKGTPQNEKTD